MTTEPIRILEAARPMLEMQDRLKDILGNQQFTAKHRSSFQTAKIFV
jgi:hypothetical protein